MNEVQLRRLFEAAVALTLAGCTQRIDPAACNAAVAGVPGLAASRSLLASVAGKLWA